MKITYEAALKAVTTLVDEDPNRTNRGECMYMLSGRPNCIAAAALSRLGVPNDVLYEMEGHIMDEIDFENINGYLGTNFTIEGDARRFLDRLQSRADNSKREEDHNAPGDEAHERRHFPDLPIGQVPWSKVLNTVITQGA